MSNPLDFVIAGQVIFVVPFLIVGARLVRSRAYLRQWRGRTTGTVVTMRSEPQLVHAGDGDGEVAGRVVETAIIRFTTAAGDVIMVNSEIAGLDVKPRPGKRVRVLYDPDEPSRMEIDTALVPGLIIAVWILAMATVLEVGCVLTTALVLSTTHI